jgi:hypothetical protein
MIHQAGKRSADGGRRELKQVDERICRPIIVAEGRGDVFCTPAQTRRCDPVSGGNGASAVKSRISRLAPKTGQAMIPSRLNYLKL